MLRASAARLWSGLSGELRRQATARRARLGAVRRDDHVRAVHRRVPVTARVDPGLRLAEHRAALVEAVTDLLAVRGIGWWWIPRGQGRPAALGLRSADRSLVLAALAAVAGPAWYADDLGGADDPMQHWRRADRLRGEPRGLLLWEFAVPTPGSGFVAGPEGGLEVWFFAEDDDAVLVCEVGNLVVHQLPATECVGRGIVPTSLRGRPSGRVGFEVDVVYTWVDGEDDAWLRRKAQAAGAADLAAATERAHDAARWADHDELRYSLRALEQFAPWVNHVWVVTAGQHPSWLARDHPWVSVVDHRDVWPDGRGLPTFNSHAIETCLHRVPGLAEHFLYLNDDMVLGRPVRAEQFFDPGGTGRFFWSRALVEHTESKPGDIASTTAARNARRLLGERYGVTFSRKFFHTAAALTVSGLQELAELYPEVVEQTRLAPFRTLGDVALAGSFYLNWAYVTGRAVPGTIRYTYVDPARPEAAGRLDALLRNRAFDAFCVNDGSSAESPEQRRVTDRLIRRFFAAYLPVPGSFEVEFDG